jgi:ubiquinone/menaquinone biosynthesis C-methylase UbiE
MVVDSKAAEKLYLLRSGGGAWERSKPFPPTGQVATEEHSQHIHDFAALLRILAPTSDDLVLDLGAGSGWVSDWLQKCGFRSVAIDISVDMLYLAAERFSGAVPLVAGDMESMPFRSHAFSKACCLNAFHHVPNQDSALKELRRVLTDDGVVFFSEPGRGHADNPTSLAAVRNYGVQEKDIIIEDFMEACLSAGFADVRLHPISHVIPLFELNRHQWSAWNRFGRSKRPLRALQKLQRALLELVGLRKTDLLFEEAFAIRLVRELHTTVEEHPIITAHCRSFEKPSAASDKALLAMLECRTNSPGAIVTLRVRVTNIGTTAWNGSRADEVRLGIQLLDGSQQVVDKDYFRISLPPLEPGSSTELRCRLPEATFRDDQSVKVDLVREGSHWFELKGTTPLLLSRDGCSGTQ